MDIKSENFTVKIKNGTTKCPVEEICEIAATDEGTDSEPARKQIPNLKNPTTKCPVDEFSESS